MSAQSVASEGLAERDWHAVRRSTMPIFRADCKTGILKAAARRNRRGLAFPRSRALVFASLMSSSIWNLANAQLRGPRLLRAGETGRGRGPRAGLEPSDIIKLASNENPLGPSPKALAAMHEALERVHFYPDGGGFYLREAVAAQFRFSARECHPRQWLERGDRVHRARLPAPGDEVITARHAFAVYALMALFSTPASSRCRTPGSATISDAMAAAITPRTREISSRIRTIPPAPSSPRRRSTGS